MSQVGQKASCDVDDAHVFDGELDKMRQFEVQPRCFSFARFASVKCKQVWSIFVGLLRIVSYQGKASIPGKKSWRNAKRQYCDCYLKTDAPLLVVFFSAVARSKMTSFLANHRRHVYNVLWSESSHFWRMLNLLIANVPLWHWFCVKKLHFSTWKNIFLDFFAGY